MFNSHSAKASVGDEDIKLALALLAKHKGMPYDIEVTKFFYRNKELHFSYSMKPKAAEPQRKVAVCRSCGTRRPCKLVTNWGPEDGAAFICEQCEKNLP